MSEFDPDLIVLDDDDVEEVPDADEAGHADDADKAVTTAGMAAPLDSNVLTEPTWNEPARSEPAPNEPAPDEPARSEPARSEPVRSEPVLSEQWHDIQAMFVDDPQGSVDRAAAAADDAVSALVASLRERLPASAAGDPGDTEQLRSTLRSYRIFCQRVADLDEELLKAGPMVR